MNDYERWAREANGGGRHKEAQVYATLYQAEQVKRVADALESPTRAKVATEKEDPLAGMVAGARAAWRAFTQ